MFYNHTKITINIKDTSSYELLPFCKNYRGKGYIASVSILARSTVKKQVALYSLALLYMGRVRMITTSRSLPAYF